VRQSAHCHGRVAELLGHHHPTTMPSPHSTTGTTALFSFPSVPRSRSLDPALPGTTATSARVCNRTTQLYEIK
jgi:hypothetical protein